MYWFQLFILTKKNNFSNYIVDACVPLKYKIRLLKAQVLKNYRTFFIQKSYGGTASPQNRVKARHTSPYISPWELLISEKYFNSKTRRFWSQRNIFSIFILRSHSSHHIYLSMLMANITIFMESINTWLAKQKLKFIVSTTSSKDQYL